MCDDATDVLARERAELAALRLEKEMLSSQVKRLVQAETKLYAYQEQLDDQLKQYKELYELNKRLATTLELPAIFEHATSYIINSLSYERVLFFQQSGGAGEFAVCASGGYYDPDELGALSGLALSERDPLLSPLLAGEEYLICTQGCDRPELAALRARIGMHEYLLCRLGSHEHPVAFLAVGNSESSAQFYSRVRGSEGELVGIGNLVGLLSSAIENVILYGGMRTAMYESKRVEESLIKLSQAVQQSPVTIVITDTCGTIEFVNPKFCQLTGYSTEEVLGQNPKVLKSELNSPELYRDLWDTISAGQVWEGEFINKKKTGELFTEHATISPVRNRDGVITHYLAIKEDITERRQLEAQLMQSQKMESIGRLAGGVAHDFNNMLSVILGCVQLAMLRVPEGDKLWQYLDQISKAAKRSSDITRQLLAFSRKEIISPREVNLNAQIIETQATLGRLIGEDIKLTFKPVTDIWTIKMDPSQLDQILVNLAVNARDAMANGGHLAIETENVRIDRTYCQYHLDAAPGDYVRLVVSDSGSGMSREILSHIFEPFFTTKEIGKGTGLGLATVYGIIKQNNGFINVYSEPGHGSSFQIYFPRFLGEAESVEYLSQPEVGGSGTVLLVEDDLLVREMSLQMLEEIGYTVIVADSPEQAVEICADPGSRVDIVLTDVVMPGMNGKEMVDLIESMRPGIKVVFMSGYTSDLVAQRGVVDEGRHFIQKPFDMHSLAMKMKDAQSD